MHFKYSVAFLLFVAVATLADSTNEPLADKDNAANLNHNSSPEDSVTAKTAETPDSKKHNTTTAQQTEPTTPTTKPTSPVPPTTKPTSPAPPTTKPTDPTPVTTPKPAPITTAKPNPTHAWIVSGVNGTDCIIASMVVKIIVPYNSGNETVNAEFNLDAVENATASGQCGPHNETLVLAWKNSSVNSTFKFIKTNSSYGLESIEVDILINNATFPNNTMVNATKMTLKYVAKVFSVPVNHSYTCTRESSVNLNGTAFNATTPLNGTILGTMTVSKVHVEAFGTGTDGKYSAPMDCSPFETPDIVPIVVGLVLAGLVVVVLIAYLVGRRRAQARGYLSM